MSFLNIALAFGAAAFAVPLLIHLLTRSRYQQVDWGAMHLLDEAVSVNSRRMRLEQWLLLLLRCLIPIILALCLARPVLTGGQSLAGSAPRSMVLLIDDSYSMEAIDGGESRFDQARRIAKDLVNALSPGSEVSVITTGGSPVALTDEPTFDVPAVLQTLTNLTPGAGANRIAMSLDAGFTTLAKMSHANRELVLLSDFQSNDWKELDASVYQNIAEQVSSLPIRPTLALFPIGSRDQKIDNVAVESLELSRHWLGVGQSLDIRVNLKNYGNDSITAMPLAITVDGKNETSKKVSLGAKAGGQVDFVTEFEEPGSHWVNIKLASTDRITTDNQRTVEITVLPRVAVLLIDGDRQGEPLKSETDFLAIALAPFAYGGVNAVDAFTTNMIRPEELNESKLKSIQAVVLANISEVNDGQLQLLDNFVKQGGCLMICPGNRIRKDWYNTKLKQRGLLPYAFGEQRGNPQSDDQATSIAEQRFEHPALDLFNRTSGNELRSAELRAWYEMQLPNKDTVAEKEADKPTTLAKLETGEPFLAEQKHALGTVYQFAIPCDADWSDLPTRPVYLPLMQQLIAQSLADTGPSRNLLTGERLAEILKGEKISDRYELTTPGGFKHSLRPVVVDEQKQIDFNQTQRPGLYRLTLDKDHDSIFCVTSPVAESDLEVLERTEVDSVAEKLGAKVGDSIESYLAFQQEQRFGREIWHWMLYGLLALMFGELILQQWFTRGGA